LVLLLNTPIHRDRDMWVNFGTLNGDGIWINIITCNFSHINTSNELLSRYASKWLLWSVIFGESRALGDHGPWKKEEVHREYPEPLSHTETKTLSLLIMITSIKSHPIFNVSLLSSFLLNTVRFSTHQILPT
jgi:hypothetical protein